MFLFNDSLTNQIDLLANAKYRLGQYGFDVATGRGYRYYYNGGADSTVVGDVAAVRGTTFGYVSTTSGEGIINAAATCAYAAGVAQAVIPNGYCGWFQTSGPGRVAIAVTDGSVAAGDGLVIDGGATPAGAVDTMAAGEEAQVFGYAITADSGTTQSADTYFLTLD